MVIIFFDEVGDFSVTELLLNLDQLVTIEPPGNGKEADLGNSILV